MAQLGVITDGIDRDLATAVGQLQAYSLTGAELQYVGDKEVGELSSAQMQDISDLQARSQFQVTCISRHVFGGMPVFDTEVSDSTYLAQLQALNRCIDLAQQLQAPLVRIMSFRKEMILFGDQGAEDWVVVRGVWDRLLHLMAPAIQLATDRQQMLVVETGNTGMVCSAALGRRLVEDLGHPEHLRVLWDPANCMYAGETAYPDGYQQLADGYIGHIHMKDAVVSPARAHVSFRQLGHGDMAAILPNLAQTLREDGYRGTMSLESVYCPPGGTFADGFRQSVEYFRELFG